MTKASDSLAGDMPSPPSADRDWRRFGWALRVVQVRLRFLAVLVAAFLIVGKWDALRNRWQTLTVSLGQEPLGGAVSPDTEYFCPMCPGVLSEWPSRCSVCNMPLVRRRKGEAIHLPDGVLSRMQFSPYRVQLAGIRTSVVEYRPLVREAVISGAVVETADEHPLDDSGSESSRMAATAAIDADIGEQDLSCLTLGAAAQAVSAAYPGHDPWSGVVSSIERRVSSRTRRVQVRVTADDAQRELWPGMGVTLRVRRPIAEFEPFRSQPANPPPLSPHDVRRLFTCPDHPQVLREAPGTCPEDDDPLTVRSLTELERVTWWCPMHPHVAANKSGQECPECNGMRLAPRIVRYRPPGEVLAVPEMAVIDTGQRRVVYLERMPGMFDGVEVTVGSLCNGYYPVVSGLEPGQRVASAGAFLIDAETRLNPSVAASYFGAARSNAPRDAAEGQAPSEEEARAMQTALNALSPAERLAARRQKSCPITGLPLGSMGAPVKIELKGRQVWLCCAGCEVEASESPDKTLKKLDALDRKRAR